MRETWEIPAPVTTLAEAQAALDRIRAFDLGPRLYGWDDPAAHEAEDALHEGVLRAIADGTAEDPAAMAALALQTTELDFSRWYE